ncbi:MAG: spermidine/putrescine ABC transporter substrate-binding protein, partial [Candidatus Cloacimonadaceae bacterium]|nr:spermidine/putrescine ABC transporter substrate-binding protein [Candidatus Cloacimonadaceae bacterium]
RYSTYDSNENMLTKIKSSRESFDVVFPSGDHVSILRQAGLLAPIDRKKISFYDSLDPDLLKKAESFDPGNQYSVPYFWGLTGLIYNNTYVPEAIVNLASWDIIGHEFFKNKNKITMLDDAREVVGAALIMAGYNINDTSDTAMEAATKILLKWDKNITQFDSDSYKNEVPDGTTWLAQAYNGDALQQISENPNLGFILPKEGASLWMDSMVILKSSKNIDLAHKFIDFLTNPENAVINAEYTQFPTPNKVAFDKLDEEIRSNPYIYPDHSYLDKCYMIEPIGESVRRIDAVYEQIKMY